MDLGWPNLPRFRPVRTLQRRARSIVFQALRSDGAACAVEIFAPPVPPPELARLRLAAEPLSPHLTSGELLDAGDGRWAFAAPLPERDLFGEVRRWRAAGGVPRPAALAILAGVAEALDAWSARYGSAHGGVALDAIGWHGDAWRLAPPPPRLDPRAPHAAPELSLGTATGKSDQFSLAACAAEALTGVFSRRLRAGAGATEQELAALRRGTDPDPAARWRYCSELVAALAGADARAVVSESAAAARTEVKFFWTPFAAAEALDRANAAGLGAPLRRSVAGEGWTLRWDNGAQAECTGRRGPRGQLLALTGTRASAATLAAALEARPADDEAVRRAPRFPCRLRAAFAARAGAMRGVRVECLALDRSEGGARLRGPVAPVGDVDLWIGARPPIAARVVRAVRRPDQVSFDLGVALAPAA